jgi:cytochrome-b5 reductase
MKAFSMAAGTLGLLPLLLSVLAVHAVTDVTAKPEGATYATDDPPCYFPTDFVAVPVRAVREVTADSRVITFGLPEGVSLSLPVSSCILMKATGAGKDGADVIKPYNPISPNTVKGSFDLLIKIYPGGGASQFAGKLEPGDMVPFKQVKPNVKPFRYPFVGVQKITMLAGGTGIAPMIQALYPILETAGETTQVRLIYSNKSPDDIMLKPELDYLASKHADRFQVIYVVGESDDDDRAVANEGWAGETGWIDEEKVGRLAFPPAEGTRVWVCGVDDMYVALAGSRLKPLAAGSALHNLGFTEDMVWRS